MVPDTEIEQRLAMLRKRMRKHKLGAYLVTRAEDVHYLSGFSGSDSILLITQTRQVLLTDGRYTEEAAKSAPAFACELWKQSPCGYAGTLLRKFHCKQVGYAPDAISVKASEALRKEARGCSFVPAGEYLEDMRVVKSAWETRQMRRALLIAETAMETVRARIQPGMTEMDLRLDLEWEMRRQGAEDVAFETIVAEGANASLPHAHAGKRTLRAGGMVLIDFGARYARYNSDLTRVFFLGSISRLWKTRYELVLQAQAAGWAALEARAGCAKADTAAREVFRTAACETFFCHSLGHGVGLAVHEAPRLSQKSAERLRPGMIVTVEPGLYYPRAGGIRIEDMARITRAGVTRLSSLPSTLEWAVV